jgi:hypothetical protein
LGKEAFVVTICHCGRIGSKFILGLQLERAIKRDSLYQSDRFCTSPPEPALGNLAAEDVKQRAKLSRLGVETASNSFHPSM